MDVSTKIEAEEALYMLADLVVKSLPKEIREMPGVLVQLSFNEDHTVEVVFQNIPDSFIEDKDKVLN